MAKKSIPAPKANPKSLPVIENKQWLALSDANPLSFFNDSWEATSMPLGLALEMASVERSVHSVLAIFDMLDIDHTHAANARENSDVSYRELTDRQRCGLKDAHVELLGAIANKLEHVREFCRSSKEPHHG